MTASRPDHSLRVIPDSSDVVRVWSLRGHYAGNCDHVETPRGNAVKNLRLYCNAISSPVSTKGLRMPFPQGGLELAS